ncbi:RNA repair domain-containing protein [Methanothermococcus sp.]|uniref:RNA repair domain-containing protein n=1 Tax=Methanothermococcus sp. TaxID=2614238 RepID=UPI0025F8D8F7|nr:RNA repair domain-containing protein [Methanothermococcus sp.]
MLKELINKIIWHPNYNPKDYEIVYLHRIGNNEKRNKDQSILKAITVDKILIEDSFIIYEVNNRTIHIPFHRILEVRNKKTGKVLYNKKQKR